MPDTYIDGNERPWNVLPWEFCDVCGDLLMVHWRGRPCLQVSQPLGAEEARLAYIQKVEIS